MNTVPSACLFILLSSMIFVSFSRACDVLLIAGLIIIVSPASLIYSN